jgi:secondary thiamine-phosphate synthase enzyme
MIHTESLIVTTSGRGLREISKDVQGVVSRTDVRTGLCSVFLHHTSASLIFGENADPTVIDDLERFVAKLVPDGSPLFRHTAEGPDDMPAHIRTVLTQTSVTLPIRDGRCDLGTWQGLFLWEHRTSPHRRRLTVTVLG